MMALSGALIAVPLNWIFDRIPGFNKIEADSETIANVLDFLEIQLLSESSLE